MSEVVATYLETLARPLDRLRFQLGDTNTEAAMLPDDTYTATLAAYGNSEVKAAAVLAAALLAQPRPSRVSLHGGAVSVEFTSLETRWREIVATARTTSGAAAMGTRTPTRGTDTGCEYRREW